MSLKQEISPHRFVCDVMLARLARYLRAAGYDTLLAEGHERDAQIVSRAVEQDRWLLTLDRRIIEHKAGQGRVLLLVHGTVEQQARWLAAQLGLDWLAKPFSRCLVDNELLIHAPSDQLVQVPDFIRSTETAFMTCPDCGRVYWSGSHHRRMQATLESWQSESPA